jgi:hypothetical protein
VCLKKCQCHKCNKPSYTGAAMKRRAKKIPHIAGGRRRGKGKRFAESKLKIFDSVSESENEEYRDGLYFMNYSRDLEDEVESERHESTDKIDTSNNKFLIKKKRLKRVLLNKDIDTSKILSEVNIDSSNFRFFD